MKYLVVYRDPETMALHLATRYVFPTLEEATQYLNSIHSAWDAEIIYAEGILGIIREEGAL